MLNYKILGALVRVDELIKQKLEESSSTSNYNKEKLRNARIKLQEAIIEIMKA